MMTPPPSGISTTSCTIGSLPSSGVKVTVKVPGRSTLMLNGAVLVTERVPADDDRLRPARHQSRHVLDDDRRAEDRAAQDVSDGAVGRQPHLLEVELLDARFVGGDGRALDADPVLLDRVRGVDGHLVVGLVAVLDAEVVVVEVDVQVGQDQRFLDELPDDPGHLVAVEFYDRAFDLDLGHRAALRGRSRAHTGAAIRYRPVALTRRVSRRPPAPR